jgi:class 3 adenylate cyclase
LCRIRRFSNDGFDDANGAPRPRERSFVDVIEELKAQTIDPIDDAATGSAEGNAGNRKFTRVLVVDDNENNLLVMANMLRPNGFEVEMLRSGEECLEFLSARIGTDDVPDVVLLDHMMGGISGVDCCAKIRQYRGMAEHELPILLVTASESDSTMQNGFLAGATDFLQKPFALSVLLARLESALRLRELFTATVFRERDRLLLRRMLPESIIDRLESGQNLIADHHDSVTVLFSDIIGFTELSQNCSTSALMLMLNELFSAFDEALDRHGVHKVETIGDAYMCVTGHDGIGNHAERMAAFAKEMIEVCDRIKPPFQRSFGHSRSGAIDSAALGGPRKKLQIRVGMHSGPVHAGVVGTRCPRYCFFGDTVNTASRMESNSFPMAVHVSNATATLLRKGGSSVETILLGSRCIKGKGIMRTHLLRMGDYLGACKLFAELQVSEGAADAPGTITPNPAVQDTNITAQKESTLARMFDTDTWVAGSLSGEGGEASPRRPSLRNPHNDSSQVRPTHHGLFDSVDSMLARKVTTETTHPKLSTLGPDADGASNLNTLTLEPYRNHRT